MGNFVFWNKITGFFKRNNRYNFKEQWLYLVAVDEWGKFNLRILTTKSAKATKKLIIIKNLYCHLRLSGRVPLAYSQVGHVHSTSNDNEDFNYN